MVFLTMIKVVSTSNMCEGQCKLQDRRVEESRIVLILLKLEYELNIVMYIRLVVKKWIPQYEAAV